MRQLQNERDAKVSDPKGTLAMIDKFIQFEARAILLILDDMSAC